MAISKRGQRKKNTKIKKRRISGFILNQSFAHLPALRMLVAGANLIEKNESCRDSGRRAISNF